MPIWEDQISWEPKRASLMGVGMWTELRNYCLVKSLAKVLFAQGQHFGQGLSLIVSTRCSSQVTDSISACVCLVLACVLGWVLQQCSKQSERRVVREVVCQPKVPRFNLPLWHPLKTSGKVKKLWRHVWASPKLCTPWLSEQHFGQGFEDSEFINYSLIFVCY